MEKLKLENELKMRFEEKKTEIELNKETKLKELEVSNQLINYFY